MKILLFLARIAFSLRYKVKINGTNKLNHNGPILLLPNHIALVDPRILISFLGKYLKVSPVASEKYYNKPLLKQVMDIFGTIPIGEMESGANSEDVKKVFGNIVDGLKDGKNILIYPSGQIYRQGFESIKGKQSVYNIAKLMPKNTKVLAIKQQGLWGSIWSKARDNGKTGFGQAYKQSLFYIFANLIFFVPKRNIDIEIIDITKQINLYKNMTMGEFNSFLENIYNKDGEQKVNFLKHFFYYNDTKNKKLPELISGSEKELNMIKKHDLSKIDKEIIENINQKIAKIKEIDIKTIKNDSKLILDLYFDSLDLAEIKSYIQANFSKASNPPINELKSTGDLYIMAIGKSEKIEELKVCNWQNFKHKGNLVELI